MYMKVSRLVFGLATVCGLSVAGFLILYLRKKKRQKSIEEHLKGGNRKQGKKSVSSLPPRTGAGDATGSTGPTDKAEAKNTQKTLLKESLEKDEAVNRSGDSAHPNSRSIQERSIDLEMLISNHDVGSLIGKGGTNIRKIQKETNTRIAAQGEPLPNGDRLYTIRGTPDAVELAESKIKKHIMSRPVLNKYEMSVPEHSIGRIIGRAGENIRSIQDRSLAHIVVDVPRTLDEGKLFTDDDYEAPKQAEGNLRTITIQGTDEQIADARQLIGDIVKDDATLRERILETTSKRTPRMNPKKTKANSDNSKATLVPISSDDKNLPLRQDKTVDIFVSCLHHPNELYFQRAGPDTIQLDKLCETMTDYYSRNPRNTEDELNYAVGDNVAAPFTDERFYRAKILQLEGDKAEIMYIDYGDRLHVKTSDLRKMKPEFLKLRFQATLATLNLECLEEEWSEEAIQETLELTHCATWQQMKAKVLGHLKEPTDPNRDIIWVEIYDAQDVNIADKLISKGLAGLKVDQPSLPIATAPVVLKSAKPTSPSTNGI